MMKPLTIAVPKGRILRQLGPLFLRAGLDPEVLYADDRRLVRSDAANGVHYLLLKPDDVPTYVEYGVADLGVVGRDVLLEREYDLYAPLDLGVGACRMMVAGLPDREPPGTKQPRRTLRVGTKYPNVAARHFRASGRTVEIVFVQGSVELAPLTGLADLIVDIVESGETLRQNGLVELEHVCDVSSVLVANRVGLKLKRERIQPLLDALAQAVA
ncbi:MAG TPA: ATP phosphoribosyltransferase [Polyangiaceae bacterium]|nr:ATP phosphoribosyltransferase [Polyangiaceae bacterium]